MSSIVNIRSIPRKPQPALHVATDDQTVEAMAMHIVAGVKGGLNTAKSMDVLDWLRQAPEMWPYQTIFNFENVAMDRAKQILIEMEMAE